MKKLLFVHIPKTGGVTINDTLIKGDYKNRFGHDFARDIRVKIPDSFDNLTKFTTVRNPWSRLVSVYTFLTKGSNIHKPPAHKDFDKMGATSFEDFIKKLYEVNKGGDDIYILNDSKPLRVNLYTRLQTNWVFDNDENQLVDYICYLDNLSEDMKTFNKKFGFNINILPPQNQTKHKYYTEMYTDETMKMVEELYAKDIEAFGFKYE